jgi:2,3-bisphosphoglycerate-independent phosphoglycerate mutase
MSVLLFFIDGLGIGARNDANPLGQLEGVDPLAVFSSDDPVIPFDGVLVRTDPRMGISGRPQSASGQTTILTGVSAPRVLGYHKQGFPNQALRDILSAHSIFLQLRNAGITPITFANAYTPKFFEERPRWVSATTVAVEAAGLGFRTLDDLVVGSAVFQDFTNRMLIERNFQIPERTPARAADALARITASNQFTLYEYFITDKIGHSQDFVAAATVLPALAEFVRTLLSNLDLDRTTVILTSDHGNIEDLSTRNHTLNDVPTLIWGWDRHEIAKRIQTLADITPAIVGTLIRRNAEQ